MVSVCLFSCNLSSKYAKENESTKEIERPNILWLVTEDMGAYIPALGDTTIVTPNLSRLAKEGVVYPNLFSPSGVCAPSRASIITGMYPTSIGANHMRTTSYTHITGLPKYESVPPAEVKMLSELMRLKGYYCTNNYKEDYQFRAPVTGWDESSPYAHWRNREKEQPFFAIFNFTTTHESGLFEPYGFREIETRYDQLGDRGYNWKNKGSSPAQNKSKESETVNYVSKDLDFKIPPYLPTTDLVKRDMWKLYNNIAETDRQVGLVLKQLEDDGLLENTIVFFYGDHGGPLPREKRLIYDSGLNTPMIIRFPNKKNAGVIDGQLISFVDFAPTLLSLVGENPKAYMQGQAFLGKYKSEQKRTYIHAAADRFDAERDILRAVRDERFKYIRNYLPDRPYYLPIAYREKIPTMKELLRLHAIGGLDTIQEQWFRESKPKEELFDCIADPFELVNLAENEKYTMKMNELSNEMDRWLMEIGDNPELKEIDLIHKLWNGNATKPQTKKPIIRIDNGYISFHSSTDGASIAYRLKAKSNVLSAWKIYTEPIKVIEGTEIEVQAHRIGYSQSEINRYISYQ